MAWADQVHVNRSQVVKASRSLQRQKDSQRRGLGPAAEAEPNSSLGALLLATAAVGAAVWARKEAHKLSGRQLPPLVQRLLHAVFGTGSKKAGSAQQPGQWRQQRPRDLAGDAAVARLGGTQVGASPQSLPSLISHLVLQTDWVGWRCLQALEGGRPLQQAAGANTPARVQQQQHSKHKKSKKSKKRKH